MFNPGDVIKLDSGRKIRLDGHLASRGQGVAHLATDLASTQKGVFKLFHTPTQDAVARLRFLVSRSSELKTACPVLFPPIDSLTSNGSVGAFTPWAPGQDLEDFLANFNATLIECLQLGVAIAQAIKALHERQFVHGDLHPGNVRVDRQGSVLKPYVIDLDNFRSPGVPEPSLLGLKEYMAPELWHAMLNHKHAIPDARTELYALGVMIHEILLVKHPATGADQDEAQFLKAIHSGWIQDPARADGVRGTTGGLPTEVLNADLMRMFRGSLNPARRERPSAADWVAALVQALPLVFVCQNCGGPCLIDASKTKCPICRHRFTLKLTGPFGQIPLRDASTVVGRSNLGGSSKVSMRHAVIRRHGPEYWLESVGQNGTRRWASGWLRLPDGQPVLIRKGDRLKLADVEAQVVEL